MHAAFGPVSVYSLTIPLWFNVLRYSYNNYLRYLLISRRQSFRHLTNNTYIIIKKRVIDEVVIYCFRSIFNQYLAELQA